MTIQASSEDRTMARFLACVVGNGMHDFEYAIKFNSTEGEVSAFVARTKLKLVAPPTAGHEVPGAVLVELLDENASEGLVQLPAQLINGSDVVAVPRRLLTPP
jgi:hypothetical protein